MYMTELRILVGFGVMLLGLCIGVDCSLDRGGELRFGRKGLWLGRLMLGVCICNFGCEMEGKTSEQGVGR